MTEIVGREAELRDLQAFVDGSSPAPSALILRGIAGIGKTILWSYGVGEGGKSHVVLSARPAEAETSLSYSALGDLLSSETDDAVASLPDPQRHALEVAVLRAEPGPRRLDQRAVAMALHAVLAVVSRDRPVLLAVDDVHWLDRPTARTLEYAFRRLHGESVRILLSERREAIGEAPLGVNRALPPERVRQMDVEGLSLAAIQYILGNRLRARISRSTLLRIHEISRGNPFFALELARALARSGAQPMPGEPLLIPGDLAQLVADRLAALPPRVQGVLLAASALARPKVSTLEQALGRPIRSTLETAPAGQRDRDQGPR